MTAKELCALRNASMNSLVSASSAPQLPLVLSQLRMFSNLFLSRLYIQPSAQMCPYFSGKTTFKEQMLLGLIILAPADTKHIVEPPQYEPSRCSHCQKLGHERSQCFELLGYPNNWGNRRFNRQNFGGGSGNARSTLNPRNRGNSDKPRRLESDDGMMTAGNGGGGYRGGSSNFTVGTPELVFSSMGMEDFAGKRVGAQTQGSNCEEGFAGFRSSQGRQNQEKIEKMSGKCSHITPIQWILDLGASHHMTSNFDILTNVYNLKTPIIILQPYGRQVKVEKASTVRIGPDIWLKDVLEPEPSSFFGPTSLNPLDDPLPMSTIILSASSASHTESNATSPTPHISPERSTILSSSLSGSSTQESGPNTDLGSPTCQGQLPSSTKSAIPSRPQCDRRPPEHLRDYVCHAIESNTLDSSPLHDASSDGKTRVATEDNNILPNSILQAMTSYP
ncbi:hypothetical protein Cgig2_013395 [Carnegiea gigantea]|uniref:Uncharacterized protein n=1 Tax=Carnegiea gigantea TaxID=171969 RepID=A0A9Q1KEC0_9CARY|nr:hypothetical protein Cgig2_013395 [Carnegiea gigantea]